ncbi:MAG: transposase domain-containing protein [Janthinobacterium lividum]
MPTDTTLLHQPVRDLAGGIQSRESALGESQLEIDRLVLIIKQFQRARFGRSAERLDPERMTFGLEELEADLARAEANRPQPIPAAEDEDTMLAPRPPHRAPLPARLPRALDRTQRQAQSGDPVIGGVCARRSSGIHDVRFSHILPGGPAAFGQGLTPCRARARSAWGRMLRWPPGGAAGCLPRSLRRPHLVQYRLMRRQDAPQRGLAFVARLRDALVHFLDPGRHLLGQSG